MEEHCKEFMKSTGFGNLGGPNRAANLELPVTSWKMKMQLCAARLMNCDVLILDEPTGHLDVDNIRLLEDWLESFTGSIICTSVKGNTLTMFVKKYPEKKVYFELSNETMKFAFPEPGPLEGVISRSKIVLAAAMWQNPQVLIISHNKEFCEALVEGEYLAALDSFVGGFHGALQDDVYSEALVGRMFVILGVNFDQKAEESSGRVQD